MVYINLGGEVLKQKKTVMYAWGSTEFYKVWDAFTVCGYWKKLTMTVLLE